LRKVLAVVLAVPVVALIYVASAAHRTIAGRTLVALLVGGTIGLGVVALVPAPQTVATPPAAIHALPRAAISNHVAIGLGLKTPVTIEFTNAMDAASVVAALRVQPMTAVRETWDPSGRALTVQPTERWRAGTFHVVTVDRGALDVFGQALTLPLRSTFVTRSAVEGLAEPTRMIGKRLGLDSGFTFTFDAPVDVGTAQAAFRIDPPIPGTLRAIGRRDGVTQFTFDPAGSLAPDTAYRVSFAAGVLDLDGEPIANTPAFEARTVAAPRVVRFRPRTGTHDVDRGAAISVRFTAPMQRARTAAAFHVLVHGKEVAGRVTWAENDTVLVFDPARALPYGVTVTMRLDATAQSKAKAPIGEAIEGRFTVEPRPVVRRVRTPVTTPIRPPSGGGHPSAGSWAAVESYYLRLMNCTRTGGWVTSTGSCSSPGGRNVAALRLDSGISSRVSRPYAKLLATRGICNHFINGNPGDRLERAGYTSYRWAENLGCRSGNPYSAVLGSHLYFQSEKPYNGGHYVNLMNAKYDRAGIGVWVSGGRVRLVIDFYHPR